MQYTVYQYIA